jgi:hypothetical protein
MPGIRKAEIALRIRDALVRGGLAVQDKGFVGSRNDLPWVCEIGFSEHSRRVFHMYFWTVGHGGRTRSQNEYRIQAKLKVERRLHVGNGTTLLLGYYDEALDLAGKAAGNDPPPGMEVFVAWDPIQHLRVGESSSCQVPFNTLYAAFLDGVASYDRRCNDGSIEQVLAFRAENMAEYIRATTAGHSRVQPQKLKKKGKL